MAIIQETLKRVICPQNLEEPCRPMTCPIPAEGCVFKTDVMAAANNPDCGRCVPIEGRRIVYPANFATRLSIRFQDLRITACGETGAGHCPKAEIITRHIAAIRAMDPKPQGETGCQYNDSCI